MRRILLAVALMLAAPLVGRSDDPAVPAPTSENQPGEKSISPAAEKLIAAAIKTRAQTLKRLETQLEKVKKGAAADKAQQRKTLEASIKKAKSAKDIEPPSLPSPLELGMIGRLPSGQVTVVEVLDKEMIVDLMYAGNEYVARTSSGGQQYAVSKPTLTKVRVMLRGVSTEGVVDGRVIDVAGVFEVVDTVKDVKTIFVVTKVDDAVLDEFRQHLPERAKQADAERK